MMKRTHGVIFVATQHPRFVFEATDAAESVRDYLPDVSITLFTDIKDAIVDPDGMFDEIVGIAPVTTFGDTWGRGLLDRVKSLSKSPFERTLFLDTDIRVMSESVMEVFSLLDDASIAMVPTRPENSISRKHYGRPMFNAGVIAYRSEPQIMKLFSEWEEIFEHHLELADRPSEDPPPYLAHIRDIKTRQMLLINDQTSLAQLLSPDVNRFDIRLRILDETWNWRGFPPRHTLPGPVRIDHQNKYKVLGDDFKKRLGEDV